MSVLPVSRLEAVASMSSYDAPKSTIGPRLSQLGSRARSGPTAPQSRKGRLNAQWGDLPMRGGGLHRSGPRSLGERHLRHHALAELHEDATADRRLAALDPGERHLEDGLSVIGVRL